MHTLVRKTLELYLREKRIITQSDYPVDVIAYASTQESAWITLYSDNRVIASSGRIQCKKENTLYECIDNTLLCLKDPRFSPALQTPDALASISIRVDRFGRDNRRLLQSIDELDITREWLILLSQSLGLMSIILPHMVHVGSTPESYLSLACQKVWLDRTKLTPNDYVLYGLTTIQSTDIG